MTRFFLPCLSLLLLFSGGVVRAADTAQLVGTVREHRGRWNPFASDNTMSPVEGGGFTATVPLSTTGGRNGDGIYAMRFYTNQDLRQVFKRGKQAGELVTGPGAAFAHNILFRVPTDGIYSVRFDPKSATYAISPPPCKLTDLSTTRREGQSVSTGAARGRQKSGTRGCPHMN
ncbi:hypothetical protein JZU57_00630 [bacterium]|nr:hypothetical protein [bacterium]